MAGISLGEVNNMWDEPKFVRLEAEHERDDILGHKIIVCEWSDDSYTVTASIPFDDLYLAQKGLNYVIDNDDWGYDTFPSDEEIQSRLEDILEQQYENPGSISNQLGI